MVLLVAAACSDPPPPEYGAAYASDFIQACRAGVGPERSEAVCRCWYERFEAATPFDELPTLDDLTSADAPSDVVDPVFYERLADCVLEVGAAVTVPPGTVPLPTLPPTTLPATTIAGGDRAGYGGGGVMHGILGR